MKKAGIDIRALSVADAQEFGILRLIVSDWKRAEEALSSSGNVLKVTEVVAVEVPDQPGGLTDLLELLEGSEINIEYMYTQTFGKGNSAVLICRFDDTDRAIAQLQKSNINVLAPVEIYQASA